MQAITFCSIAFGSFAAISLVRDIFRSKSSSDVVPLNVPQSVFAEPSYEISSAILTRTINEGTLWLYFYENGTCRPVFAVRSSRLKKKLGVYRFRFESVSVPNDVCRDVFADKQKEIVTAFVKEKLAVAKSLKEVSPSIPEVENSVAQTPTLEVKPVPTKRLFKGLVLVSSTYESFPFGNSHDVSALRFCARFKKGTKDFCFWGSDMRRALNVSKAEVGSTCNVIDFGKTQVSDKEGKTFDQRLYEVDLVKQ